MEAAGIPRIESEFNPLHANGANSSVHSACSPERWVVVLEELANGGDEIARDVYDHAGQGLGLSDLGRSLQFGCHTPQSCL